MAIIKGVGEFFALDIGSNAIRIVQLTSTGQQGSWVLSHFGYAPIDSHLTMANSEEARKKLGKIIVTALGQSGIRTKNVVIGLPSQKTFTTVIDVPTMPEAELRNSIKYQIDQYIPMSIDEAQIDWSLLGQSMHDPKMLEVILASTGKAYSEERLELIESIGLNVVAAEPDPIAMTRSLLPVGVQDARILIDMGENSTDVVIAFGDNPRLVRTIPTGLQTLVKAAAQNLNVQEDQARQFILKFGLSPDKLDGVVAHVLETTLESFMIELTKSTKFFQTRYPSVPIGGVVLSGFGVVIPLLNNYVNTKTGFNVELSNLWQRVNMSEQDRQQLAPVAYEFATVVGLAMRSNKA